MFESQAYVSRVGADGGFLLASTIHDYFIQEHIAVFGREIQPTASVPDVLLTYVGLSFSSECVRVRVRVCVCVCVCVWVGED